MPKVKTLKVERADRPLLKWAGGKGKMVPQLVPAIRAHLERNPTGRYFEPFLGGGAVALALGLGERMVLGDVNVDLINFYQQVRDNVGELCYVTSALCIAGVDEDHFYRVRDWQHPGADPWCPLQRAAWFMYINRLGFNGIMRFNAAGKCNTPAGSAAKAISYRRSIVERVSRDAITSLFPNREIYQDAANALAGASLTAGGFDVQLLFAGAGGRPDIVYLDPPYHRAKYGYGAGFEDKQQEQLAVLSESLVRDCGVTVICSNSDTPEVRKWWSWANIEQTQESRVINSATDKRKEKAPCVLIVGAPS